MKNILKLTAAGGLALLVAGFLLAGCESDSVAPQDATPELTEANAANQAAMVAMAITEVGPQLVNFTPSKNVYTYNFAGYDYVSGEVEIDFRLGGAEGSPATPGQADYAHMTTLGDGLVVIISGDWESAMLLTADIMGNIDQENETATILAGSGGTLIVGVLMGTYAVDGLVVGGTGYPAAGTLTFTGGDHTITVTFDGSQFAHLAADGAQWTLDLSDGTLTELD